MKAVALGPGRSSRSCGEGAAEWELQGHSVLPLGLTGGGGGVVVAAAEEPLVL